jgi:LruC domain-containing protein
MRIRFSLLVLVLASLSIFGCKGDPPAPIVEEEEEEVGSSNPIDELEVPDGFNYATSKLIAFDFTMIDSIGEAAPGVLTTIIGESDEADPGTLFTGVADENGIFSVEIDVANHFSELVVKTDYDGSIKGFVYDNSEAISGELTVNGQNNFLTLDERTNNCYPTVSSLFSADNKSIGVSSTKPLQSAVVYYSDGTSQTVTNAAGNVFFSNSSEICDNGIDDDGDGFIDCADPECGTDLSECSGSIPCVSSFFQIVGKSLKQLDPVTGSYKNVGNLPNSFDVYNGGGYNPSDGYIYCTGKVNSTGKVYMVRLYSNANITNLGELVGFEGRSYTGDMDDDGNWTNFYYQDDRWHMATVAVNSANLSFNTEQGAPSDVVNPSFHDWVYNRVCDKFYTMTAGGKELLEADHKANPITVRSVDTYSGLPGGAYGAAWSDEDGHVYFSNNNTGKIYKVTMNGCSPGSITNIFTGAATSNNDGMSCPSAPIAEFNGNDTDNDGLTDNQELGTYTNPLDACSPLFDAPSCDGILNNGFVIQAPAGKTIAYVQVDFNCDAPDEYSYVFNNNVDNDIDDDGVPNALDPNPDDPNQSFVQYRPSQNSFGTYGFEDLWPEVGDYDFNDFVVQVKEKIITNSANRVYRVIYDLKVMAMGGIFNNNFGIVTPDPGNNAAVKIISPHNVTWTSSQRGNTEVIIIQKPKQLFYSLGVINAWNSDPYFAPVEIQVQVDLNGSYSYPSGYKPSFFIEQNGISGHEIHIAGVAPTSNLRSGLFGTAHDDSKPNSSKYYLTSTNLPWGIYMPTEWNYPQEGIDLTAAYKRFAEYAQTNPNLAWYTNTSDNVVSSRVYTRH